MNKPDLISIILIFLSICYAVAAFFAIFYKGQLKKERNKPRAANGEIIDESETIEFIPNQAPYDETQRDYLREQAQIRHEQHAARVREAYEQQQKNIDPFGKYIEGLDNNSEA